MKIIKRHFKKILAVLVGIILLTAIYLNTFLLLKYNLLPLKYWIIYSIIVLVIPLILIFLTIFKRLKIWLYYLLIVLEGLFIAILIAVFMYLNTTFNFIDNFTNNNNYEMKNYYVVTLKDSNYKKLNDLSQKQIGYVASLDTSIDKALKDLSKKIDFSRKEYSGFSEAFDDLYNNNSQAILIIESFYDMLREEDENLLSKTQVLYKFSIKEEINDISKDVDVTKETFNVYLSGIGSYGSVNSKALSDVNMLITINPKTHNVLMVNIPRDYFVELAGIGQKDKLTHAGMYGVETSVGTIENLFDLEINYYIKVNYNALVKLVDALDGVDVYSNHSFTSTFKYYRFNEGYNHVNGDQALEFVRTRIAFLEGDRVRGENQQAMIQAIFKKAYSPSILIKYNELLKALDDCFTTNMSSEKIMNLISTQIDKMPNWNIESTSVNGSDFKSFTYTYPTQELYVMLPDENTINEAKEKIRITAEGK